MTPSNHIVKDFPLLVSKKSKDGFVYLDSAATSQKPQRVIDAYQVWYEKFNANIHRGAYHLAERATDLYEGVRGKTAQFLQVQNPKSIVFTRGTTEGINTVAEAWAKYNLSEGDTILLTEMEHHANIVPWQQLAQEKNLHIKYWPITDTGELVDLSYDDLFKGVKLLALAHVSNVLGTINPIESIIKIAHDHGVAVLIDAAQSVGHMPLDIGKLDPDFLVFSAHKMLGPTGLGVLYIKPERFAELQPYQTGGDMIRKVTFETTTFKPMPWLLEAGTMPLAEVFSFGEALDYLSGIGMKKIEHHDRLLVSYLYDCLEKLSDVVILGPKADKRSGLVGWYSPLVHAHDMATFLNEKNIAIRAGHHCAQPLHERLGVVASARASVYVYTTKEDIDMFITALVEVFDYWKSQS